MKEKKRFRKNRTSDEEHVQDNTPEQDVLDTSSSSSDLSDSTYIVNVQDPKVLCDPPPQFPARWKKVPYKPSVTLSTIVESARPSNPEFVDE